MKPLHPLAFLSWLGGTVAAVFLGYFFLGIPSIDPSTHYGVTWSMTYADALGINGTAGLNATLNDLNVKEFRIPAYWSELEPNRDQYQLDYLKDQLDAIARHGAKAIVVVGATQPRWPECWMPGWARSLPQDQEQMAQLEYVTWVVKSFAHHPAVKAWQI